MVKFMLWIFKDWPCYPKYKINHFEQFLAYLLFQKQAWKRKRSLCILWILQEEMGGYNTPSLVFASPYKEVKCKAWVGLCKIKPVWVCTKIWLKPQRRALPPAIGKWHSCKPLCNQQCAVTSGSPHLCKLSYLSSSMRFFAVKFSMLHAFNCVLQLLVK